MEVSGVFNTWVTALIKASCCSLRRISRIRNVVLRTSPVISNRKKTMPKTSRATSRGLSRIQPTLSAIASATRQAPSVLKKAIDLRRPLTAIGAIVMPEGRKQNAEREKQKQQASNPLPTAYCLLPTAYCLLLPLGCFLQLGNLRVRSPLYLLLADESDALGETKYL